MHGLPSDVAVRLDPGSGPRARRGDARGSSPNAAAAASPERASWPTRSCGSSATASPPRGSAGEFDPTPLAKEFDEFIAAGGKEADARRQRFRQVLLIVADVLRESIRDALRKPAIAGRGARRPRSHARSRGAARPQRQPGDAPGMLAGRFGGEPHRLVWAALLGGDEARAAHCFDLKAYCADSS